ncbi:hypothetical protein [Arthrobacter dokdonensis]|uniref:hypothetical protein n=1 Tax=Arthrobacter dokdonellae TaxID=2211210 RepID=UPI000DE5BADA|nr:hypothetical protein [Arthrobacter dokdonellae]
MNGAAAASSGGGSVRPRKGRYSANLGLVVVVVVVMGGAMLIAAGLQLGGGTIIAGFTAIFFTIGIGGGALRADPNLKAALSPESCR